MGKGKSKGSYMISSVAEQYAIHPQTLRLYEREGLLKPSRSDGNTRLYTDGDLERLEVILHLTRELGVNLAGVEIILNMREKMAEMQLQIEEFVSTLNRELVARRRPAAPEEQHSLIRVVNYSTAWRRAVLPTRKSRGSGQNSSTQALSVRFHEPGWNCAVRLSCLQARLFQLLQSVVAPRLYPGDRSAITRHRKSIGPLYLIGTAKYRSAGARKTAPVQRSLAPGKCKWFRHM